MPPTTTGWRTRIVGSGTEAPDQLLANPNNWRTHPARQREALRGSLGEIGWVQQVLVNRTTGNLVDGHARVEEALTRGEPAVPVLYVELSPAEEAVVLASLDPIGAMADQDGDRLRLLLEGISVDDDGLRALLDEMRGDKPGKTHPDDAPELPDPADLWIAPGELWQLGDHRLLVANAAAEASWDRLMADGAEADCIWTDPPYGIAYQTKLDPDEAVASHRRRDGLTVANDELGEPELEALLRAVLGHAIAHTEPGRAVYVASSAGATGWVTVQLLRELGIYRQTILWVKDAFVLGRHDYHYRHEPIHAGPTPGTPRRQARGSTPIHYGWRPGAKHYFVDDRTLDTVWEIPRPRRSAEHPTMKPVELIERSLRASTRTGELVVDPFAGSGSTLIAAEKLRRRAYLMEIDPRYAQVIVERWQDHTGAKAARLE